MNSTAPTKYFAKKTAQHDHIEVNDLVAASSGVGFKILFLFLNQWTQHKLVPEKYKER